MITRIIDLSIRHRFLVLLLTAALVGAGVFSLTRLRLDAIPDLSDVQVIVTTEYQGQNPQVVDDQVTYPLASALLSVPGATAVRGYSMFEQSFVYVLFEDGTDTYWARSRVLEYLNYAKGRLPQGVEPKLGPDATGVGWVYQYVLYPGYYSPKHPQGLWVDEDSGPKSYVLSPKSTDHAATQDLWTQDSGPSFRWYEKPADAPPGHHLEHIRAWERPGKDPLTGDALVPANQDLSQLRTLQDWYLRYPLSSVEDVSEVAPIGGFVRQYQVSLDPVKLDAYGVPLRDVIEAIKKSNNDVGGSVLEMSENEYMVRSRGYLKTLDDLGRIPVGMGMDAPVRLKDVASLEVGGEARRGVGELNGEGEAVGGIVIARFGANAYKVIQDVKAKLAQLEDGLPPGVIIKPTYDRSQLIERSVSTLRHTLIEEILVVGLVCILFLLHLRSELVAVFVVPSSVIVALLAMQALGINANIMSLGGVAISIGVVVDSAIVMVENAHKHLDRLSESTPQSAIPNPQSRSAAILAAAKEVGPQLFFSLLIITVSFLPVFVLGGEAGRLFRPLAFTKTFAMAAAAVLSITIIPVLMYYFITGRVLPKQWGPARNTLITLGSAVLPAAALFLISERLPHLAAYRWWIAGGWAVLVLMLLLPQRIIHEHKNPISRGLQALYEPFFRAAMSSPALVIFIALVALASTYIPLTRLGTEFMPPLDEGDLLYMPTTDPSISIGKSKQLLQQTDKLIKTFPEVLSVHGKIGRADTATDPAPLSMIETVVQLNPDHEQWRHRPVSNFFSGWPAAARWPFEHTFWPASRPITTEELKFGWEDAAGMHPGLNSAVSFPGVANAWPFPIENRTNMLATGIKTPVGIKVTGPDLKVLSDLADKAAAAVRAIPGTVSAFAERTFGGFYLDIDIDREQAARYGLTTGDVQDVIQSAIGGMNITTVVQGQERYPLNVRYQRDFREDIPALERVLISLPPSGRAGEGLAKFQSVADSTNPQSQVPSSQSAIPNPQPQVPLGQLAKVHITPGPPMIRSENAAHANWVYVDIAGRDLGGYIADARRAVAEQVQLPPGYALTFSGQFEFWEKTLPRLVAASALALVLIIVLLYGASQSWLRVGIVMLAVPFSLIGALWFMHLLNYNLSLAAVIGMIALAGLDAETGMVMLLYLDNSFERAGAAGRMRSREDLWSAVHEGAVKRIRPKAMTVAAAFIGLLPLLWAEGAGADTMRRIAAPMIGGLLVSFVMELLVYPVVYYLARSRNVRA